MATQRATDGNDYILTMGAVQEGTTPEYRLNVRSLHVVSLPACIALANALSFDKMIECHKIISHESVFAPTFVSASPVSADTEFGFR